MGHVDIRATLKAAYAAQPGLEGWMDALVHRHFKGDLAHWVDAAPRSASRGWIVLLGPDRSQMIYLPVQRQPGKGHLQVSVCQVKHGLTGGRTPSSMGADIAATLEKAPRHKRFKEAFHGSHPSVLWPEPKWQPSYLDPALEARLFDTAEGLDGYIEAHLRSSPMPSPMRTAVSAILRCHAQVMNDRASLALVQAMPPEHLALAHEVFCNPALPPLSPRTLQVLAAVLAQRRPDWHIQALKAAPFLANAFALNHGFANAGEGHGPGLLSRIDAGEAPLSVVRDLAPFVYWDEASRPDPASLPNALVRTVLRGRLTMGWLGRGNYRDKAYAATASGLSRPKAGIVDVLACYHDTNPIRPPLTHDDVEKLRGVDWHGYYVMDSAEAVGAAVRCMVGQDGRIVPPPEGFRDAIRSIGVSLIRVLALDGIADDAVRDEALARAIGRVVFATRRNPEALAALDRRWHAGVPKFESDLAIAEDGIAERQALAAGRPFMQRFPHVCDGPVTVDGVTFTPLLDRGALAREGVEMKHCVGTYHAKARRAKFVLFGVRSDEGRSTLSLKVMCPQDGEPYLASSEHKGIRNQPAPLANKASAAAFLRSISPSRVRGMAETQRFASLSPDACDTSALTEAEASLLDAIHMSNVSPWLTSAERAMPLSDWVRTMGPDAPAEEEAPEPVERASFRP